MIFSYLELGGYLVQQSGTIWTTFVSSRFYKLEFRESDVSPGKTVVKQGKFVEFISPVKGYFIVQM